MADWTTPMASWITRRPFVLCLILYGIVGVIGWTAYNLLPFPFPEAIRALIGSSGLGVMDPEIFAREPVVGPPPDAPMWAITAVAMTAAALLGTPTAWLYTITRHKRGYQQSLVHSLILLPVVVAGVVVLVKHSLALAFSLAGIVAAVRFRNTLEDSKDAVYIFVATGVGLAAGVELAAAAVLSFFFNLTTLSLFQSDFGRTPARLEGDLAEKRMRKALAIANRTSQFVARLDDEVLKSMAPEQLEALVDRAWRRRKESAPDVVAVEGDAKGKLDCLLSVRTANPNKAREVVEELLGEQTKSWKYQGTDHGEEGEQTIRYALQFKKNVQVTSFLDTVRQKGAESVLEVNVR